MATLFSIVLTMGSTQLQFMMLLVSISYVANVFVKTLDTQTTGSKKSVDHKTGLSLHCV